MMIHVLTGGEQPEEISLDQVTHRLKTGKLTGDELAWRPGLEEWVPLTTIPEVAWTGIAPPVSASPVPPSVPDFPAKVAPAAEPQQSVGFRGWYRRILALVMLAGGIGLLCSDYWFIWSSAQTTGTMTSTPKGHSVGGRKKHTEYYVDYTYQVAGKTYTGHDSIRRFPSSRDLPVYYGRWNPSDSKAHLPETGIAWGLFAMGTGLSLYYFRPWNWRRKNA